MNIEAMSSRDQIKYAARMVLKQGQRPSQNNVKEHLTKTSSNNTIGKALDEFWVELAEELKAIDTQPGMPDEVTEMLRELWRLSLKSGQAAFEDRMQQAIEVEARAKDAAQEALHKHGLLEKECERLSAELDKAQSLLARERASASERAAVLVKSQETVKDLQAQLQNTIQRNDDFRESSDARLDAQTAKIDAMREQYRLSEIENTDKLHQALEENKRLENALSACRHVVSNLEKYKELHEHQLSENGRQRAQLDASQSENTSLSGQIQNLMARIERESAAHTEAVMKIEATVERRIEQSRQGQLEQIDALKQKLKFQEERQQLQSLQLRESEDTIKELRDQLGE